MAGPSLQTTGHILQKPPAEDRHQQVLLLSAEAGPLLCFQRISSRQPAVALDLFDEVAATLTTSNQGRTWFFGEVRVQRRFSGIGLSFAALREASAFATLLTRNPVHEESRAAVLGLLGTALRSWNDGRRADAVALKALYSFAKIEGYPVKEEWAASLRGSDRENVRRVLNEPLAALEGIEADSVERLLGSLRRYLRGEAELILD